MLRTGTICMFAIIVIITTTSAKGEGHIDCSAADVLEATMSVAWLFGNIEENTACMRIDDQENCYNTDNCFWYSVDDCRLCIDKTYLDASEPAEMDTVCRLKLCIDKTYLEASAPAEIQKNGSAEAAAGEKDTVSFYGMHNCSTTASFRCDVDSDCSGHGYCNNDLRCVCNNGYVCEDCQQQVVRVEPSNLMCVDSTPAKAGYPTLGDCPAFADQGGTSSYGTNAYLDNSPSVLGHDVLLLYNLQNVLPKGYTIHAASLVINQGVSSWGGAQGGLYPGHEIAVHNASSEWIPGVTRNKDAPKSQEFLGTWTIPGACCVGTGGDGDMHCLTAYQPSMADCTTTVVPRFDVTSEIVSTLGGTLAVRLHLITDRRSGFTRPGASFGISYPALVNIEIFGEAPDIPPGDKKSTTLAGTTQITPGPTARVTNTPDRRPNDAGTGVKANETRHSHAGLIAAISILGIAVVVLGILVSRMYLQPQLDQRGPQALFENPMVQTQPPLMFGTPSDAVDAVMSENTCESGQKAAKNCARTKANKSAYCKSHTCKTKKCYQWKSSKVQHCVQHQGSSDL